MASWLLAVAPVGDHDLVAGLVVAHGDHEAELDSTASPADLRDDVVVARARRSAGLPLTHRLRPRRRRARPIRSASAIDEVGALDAEPAVRRPCPTRSARRPPGARGRSGWRSRTPASLAGQVGGDADDRAAGVDQRAAGPRRPRSGRRSGSGRGATRRRRRGAARPRSTTPVVTDGSPSRSRSASRGRWLGHPTARSAEDPSTATVRLPASMETHGDVGGQVGAEELALDAPAVGQHHGDRGGAGDLVGAGEHQAVVPDHDPARPAMVPSSLVTTRCTTAGASFSARAATPGSSSRIGLVTDGRDGHLLHDGLLGGAWRQVPATASAPPHRAAPTRPATTATGQTDCARSAARRSAAGPASVPPGPQRRQLGRDGARADRRGGAEDRCRCRRRRHRRPWAWVQTVVAAPRREDRGQPKVARMDRAPAAAPAIGRRLGRAQPGPLPAGGRRVDVGGAARLRCHGHLHRHRSRPRTRAARRPPARVRGLRGARGRRGCAALLARGADPLAHGRSRRAAPPHGRRGAGGRGRGRRRVGAPPRPRPSRPLGSPSTSSSAPCRSGSARRGRAARAGASRRSTSPRSSGTTLVSALVFLLIVVVVCAIGGVRAVAAAPRSRTRSSPASTPSAARWTPWRRPPTTPSPSSGGPSAPRPAGPPAGDEGR